MEGEEQWPEYPGDNYEYATEEDIETKLQEPVSEAIKEQDAEITKEIEEKGVEKPKPKRKQTAKQLAAFEKARKKRSENIAARKAAKPLPVLKPEPTQQRHFPQVER